VQKANKKTEDVTQSPPLGGWGAFNIAQKYLNYYLTASNGKGHGIHPPFIYDFVTNVLNDKKDNAEYKIVEQLRNNLLENNIIIEVEDFGAGSTTGATKNRSIKSIAKNAAKPKKFAQLLYRIVQYYSCRNIIELGTSLGISSSYMSLANEFGRVNTCEGSKAIAAIAKENFKQLCIKNITVFEGEFKTSYAKALMDMPSIDLLFIDGNHQYQPTLDYFEKALPQLHENSMVIFDDIHWSADMERAWNDIKKHNAISETIDLFFIGIAFFRKDQKAKQDFVIRF
jgi:predicted O-methyltransferase YrrM